MPIKNSKMGILLLNLGTPDSVLVKDVKKFLREFLSDPKVIEFPRILWLPFLYCILSVFKAPKSAKNYQKIWDYKLNDSPLRIITKCQSQDLSKRIGSNKIIIDWAMRYGNPSIKSKLINLINQGCDQILIAPLYPQYSSTTTATAVNEVFRIIKKMHFQPTISIMPPYFNHPAYISALAKSITLHFNKNNFKPDVILASFHGLPEISLKNGDPYYYQSIETTRLLSKYLNLGEKGIITSFQSRFGKKKWLQPYTYSTVIKLAKQGIKKLAILSPGFSSDCLETLEEICIKIRNDFINAGGVDFTFIPCLNDSIYGQNMLELLIKNEIYAFKFKINTF